MIFFICLAQLRCPCKGKPWGWDPAGCCRGCQHFSVLPMSTWSPLLLPWPLPAAWWYRLLTLCINPSLSAFQALPWAWVCSYSTPKAGFSARERADQRREDTLHRGAPVSFAWDASLSSCNTPKPAAEPMMPIRLSFNELWCVSPSRTEEISSRLPGLHR